MSKEHSVLVFGAGKIGITIASLLDNTGDYRVVLADKDPQALERATKFSTVETMKLDAEDKVSLAKALLEVEQVICAGPFFVNPAIARGALEAGVSYFDLTEDRKTTETIRYIAESATEGQVFVPQCGLAPGFVSILAADLVKQFDRVEDVKMRVGALPQYPSNRLMYNLTWSTDGVVNEYINACEALVDGRRVEVQPLEGLEAFSLDGVQYEAFNTSGGLGTLCETFEGKISSLDYKSVRYPGHRSLAQFLLQDLKLSRQPQLLKELLENAVPITMQDVVLVLCAVSGYRDGMLEQLSDARKLYGRELYGRRWSAIQLTTAAGICAVLDLHAQGHLSQRGFVQQEDIPLEAFLENRFGDYYRSGAMEKYEYNTVQSG